jgi:hypothetical protein
MHGVPRQSVPAVGSHQLGPPVVKLPVVAFAEAMIAGPGAERGIEALVAEPHLVVDRDTPGHHAAAGLGAFLPIVHVVLLERAGRAEAAHAGEAEGILDLLRCYLVDKDPGPDLGLFRAARVPYSERPGGAPQQREIRKDGVPTIGLISAERGPSLVLTSGRISRS